MFRQQQTTNSKNIYIEDQEKYVRNLENFNKNDSSIEFVLQNKNNTKYLVKNLSPKVLNIEEKGFNTKRNKKPNIIQKADVEEISSNFSDEFVEKSGFDMNIQKY